MAGTTRLELATSAVTVTLSDCKQMISWASMAIFSTLEHSKTLGKTRISIFSTLASTLKKGQIRGCEAFGPLPCIGSNLC
jgi:AMMECR1 domain-containing protein